MVRALTQPPPPLPAPHRCNPGSHYGVDSICGLNLWLVLSLIVPRGLSSGLTSGFPLSSKINTSKFQGSRRGRLGWRSAARTRPQPTWPKFTLRGRWHMWGEYVAGSLPYCSEGFFFGLTSSFPLSSKISTSKFQFDLELTDTFQVFRG